MSDEGFRDFAPKIGGSSRLLPDVPPPRFFNRGPRPVEKIDPELMPEQLHMEPPSLERELDAIVNAASDSPILRYLSQVADEIDNIAETQRKKHELLYDQVKKFARDVRDIGNEMSRRYEEELNRMTHSVEAIRSVVEDLKNENFKPRKVGGIRRKENEDDNDAA